MTQGGGDHGGPLCGMVFKIVHHPQKGPLCFVRIYAGHLTQRQVIIQHPLNRVVEPEPEYQWIGTGTVTC
jgi:translation elongation factor EF-G